MPRVHFVKRARKPNSVVTQEDIDRAKSGEAPGAASYYYWEFRYGGTVRSKTSPRQSQLTQSDFLSQAYGFAERIEDLDRSMSISDLESEVTMLAEEIRALGEEQSEKRDNMPEQLQDAPSGEMLQERYDGCEEWATNLESVDFSIDEEEPDREALLAEAKEEVKEEGLEDEDIETLLEEKVEAKQEEIDERKEEIFEEVQSFGYEGS